MLNRAVLLSPNALTTGHALDRDMHNESGHLAAETRSAVGPARLPLMRQRGSSVRVVATEKGATLDHLFRHWQFSSGMRHLKELIHDYRLSTDC